METTLVYRVESEIGAGPYRCTSRSDETCLELGTHCNDNGRPVPDDDFPGGLMWIELLPFYNSGHRDHVVFGFSSMDRLHKWFDKDAYKLLKEDRFQLLTYRVPIDKIKESDSGSQLVFDETKAILVSLEPLP